MRLRAAAISALVIAVKKTYDFLAAIVKPKDRTKGMRVGYPPHLQRPRRNHIDVAVQDQRSAFRPVDLACADNVKGFVIAHVYRREAA
jgi:hypothetical protein